MGRGKTVSGFSHQLPVCGEVSGDSLVVEAESEDLDGHAPGPSGPIVRVRHDQSTFSGTQYPTPLLSSRTVSGSDQGDSRGLIFEVGWELEVEPRRGCIAGTEPIILKVFALVAFLGFFSQVL